MVFTSIPSYLDPAHWQQLTTDHIQVVPSSSPSAPQLPPGPPQPIGGGGAGSIRPGSMTDRARLANIPMPEAALKCPRCESTNTKFCYFNNYNLTQPRYFCKACKRYWTRGGALRNVPVGGGCRRNKRSKGSSSKSSVTVDRGTASSSSKSIASADALGLGPQVPALRLMAPLQQLTGFGLNYWTISAPSDLNAWNGGVTDPGMTGSDQCLESCGLYQFESAGDGAWGYGVGAGHQVRPKISSSGSGSGSAPAQMEGNNQQEMNFARQFLGVPGNDQFWADVSSFSSSSTSNP
ncbi:hypothetical protein V6N13_081082 [Hibiscus sabdariffa]|uniref:Dof zinc finger protein n=1 Tax=Hibiscus sabdariffa TaxID=183260 RepID=A0ABR2DBF2_9ROSI